MLTLIFTLMMDELNLVVNFRFQFTTLNLNIISYRFFHLNKKMFSIAKSFCWNKYRRMWTRQSKWYLDKQLRLVFKWNSFLYSTPSVKSFWNPFELMSVVMRVHARNDFVFSSYHSYNMSHIGSIFLKLKKSRMMIWWQINAMYVPVRWILSDIIQQKSLMNQ